MQIASDGTTNRSACVGDSIAEPQQNDRRAPPEGLLLMLSQRPGEEALRVIA
jgi:hypothetical protein